MPETSINFSRTELVDLLTKKLPEACENYGISFAYLGGSWASGHQTVFSDVDLFVSWPKVNFLRSEDFLKEFLDLNSVIFDLTGLDKLEITVLERIPLHLQFNAIARGILIWEKEKRIRQEYVEKLLLGYYDHIIWYQRYLEEATASLRD